MAAFCYFLYISVLCLQYLKTACYTVHVTIKEGDVVEEFTKYYVVNKDVPPFNYFPESSEAEEPESQGGVVSSGFLGNTRNRRSPKVGKMCQKDADDFRNQAITIETGETIHLACHSCSVKHGDRYQPMQWIKLNYSPDSTGLYRVHEIIPELHFDEKRNRIATSIDHTLTIKRAKLSDAGSYFCKRPDKINFLDLKLTWSELTKYLAEYSQMQNYYHVDVIELESGEIIDVSHDSENKPRKPEVVPDLNIVVETRWHAWSACSVCDDEGVRKRIGLCTVRKLDFSYRTADKYLDHILSFARNGVPCQSQFFNDFADEKWRQHPNEFQMEQCSVPCPSEKSKRRKRSISKEEMLKTSNKRKPKKQKVEVGTYLVLVCPGSSLTKTVVWVNGTEHLPLMTIKKKSVKRISFDMFGNMHIQSTVPSDSGIYSCWIENKLKRKFLVQVVPDSSAEILDYLLLVIFSFGFDFIAFMVLTCSRICNRKVQKRRKRKKKTEEKTGEQKEDSE